MASQNVALMDNKPMFLEVGTVYLGGRKGWIMSRRPPFFC